MLAIGIAFLLGAMFGGTLGALMTLAVYSQRQ